MRPHVLPTAQVELGKTRVVELGEGEPEGSLPVDSDHQSFELDETRQRRIAAEPAVQLEATDLLSGPGGRNLRPRWSNSQLRHHVKERPAVISDLTFELLEQRLEGSTGILLARALDQLEPKPRAGPVVVQIDREEFLVHESAGGTGIPLAALVKRPRLRPGAQSRAGRRDSTGRGRVFFGAADRINSALLPERATRWRKAQCCWRVGHMGRADQIGEGTRCGFVLSHAPCHLPRIIERGGEAAGRRRRLLSQAPVRRDSLKPTRRLGAKS